MTTTVLSLGAGVQSSTLLLMACVGEMEKPTFAVFADTHYEPATVYRHLDWLTGQATVAGIPIERVTAGNIRDDMLAASPPSAQAATQFVTMPLYSRNLDGRPSMLRRQCTKEYKLTPIMRYLRSLGATAANPVELWLGISLDEATRMKPAQVRYIQNRWPLIERRMSRLDCLNWLEVHDYPRPPKSSCIGCPFHDDRYWHDLKVNSPNEWRDAVAFDAAIRMQSRTGEAAFIHRSLVPLGEVDLSTPQERGQLDMFDQECLGMCGV